MAFTTHCILTYKTNKQQMTFNSNFALPGSNYSSPSLS